MAIILLWVFKKVDAVHLQQQTSYLRSLVLFLDKKKFP
jgi:hypothetical protein